MRDEEQGYIRVVNVRGDKDCCPIPSEKLIMVDRAHPVLGNRHIMKTKSRVERERVIDAFRKDIESDIAVGGSMSKALMDLAKDIVENNAKIGAGCWCAGACHGDVIAEKVREIVIVLHEEKNLACKADESGSAPPKNKL